MVGDHSIVLFALTLVLCVLPRMEKKLKVIYSFHVLFQDDKMKQSLKMKLEMAKFLQQTLDEMAVTGKGHSSKAAKDFVEFFEKVMYCLVFFYLILA